MIINLFLIICSICFFVSVLGFCLHSCSFLYLSRAGRKPEAPAEPGFSSEEMPFHIIQIPVYNEDPQMVKGLLESACRVTYPDAKILIQLLDDSNQPEISQKLKEMTYGLGEFYSDREISYLHRPSRKSFKAGNLNYGLEMAAEYMKSLGENDPARVIISIFDADFIIPQNYLAETTHLFKNPDTGAVQVDLSFRNGNFNSLTRAQEVFLRNLHRLDFAARSRTGHLTTFRGAGGSWRLKAIQDCGGWQGDTQIEDVDMSFAAQISGWKIIYVEHLSTDSLLPTTCTAYKLQQRSWMKGIMEVMRKHLGTILKSPRFTLLQKIMALDFFMVLSLQALFFVLVHLTLIPTYYLADNLGYSHLMGPVAIFLPLLLAATHIPFFVINMSPADSVSNNPLKNSLYSFWLMTAIFLPLTFGIIEGLLGVRVHRDRTEKTTRRTTTVPPSVSSGILQRICVFEILMALFSLAVVYWAGFKGERAIMVVFSVPAVIYPLTALISLRDLLKSSRLFRGKASTLSLFL